MFIEENWIDDEQNKSKPFSKRKILYYIFIILTISTPWWWQYIFGEKNDYDFSCQLITIPENYRIDISNNGFVFDTLKIDFRTDSCSILIINDFKLINYSFINDYYFYSEAIGEPSLEISDLFIENPLLNKSNIEESAYLEFKRKIIFDGFKVAYFEKFDKTKIGNMNISYSYKIDNEIKLDSINVDIILWKKE